MVKIRLKRVGKRKQPSYRVVVADSRSPRDGRIIESIGHYHPRSEPSEVIIDTERADYWISQGAQPSDAVRKLLAIASGQAATPAAQPKAAAVKATLAASVTEGDDAALEADEKPAAAPPAAPPAAPEADLDSDA